MTDEEKLEAIVATEIERLHRMSMLGDFGTAGPVDHPPVASRPDHSAFPGGYWIGARRVDPHPHRRGGATDPCVILDHTTDMHPDDWDALIEGWVKRPGDGACANLLVGQTEQHGVVQFTPIDHNGNHAGGLPPPNGHGWFVDPARPGNIHPNLLTVGIEFHSAGGMLRLIGGAWRFVEDGKIHGAPIAPSEVEPDPQRPGRGWHLLTPYQKMIRDWLHSDLDKALRPLPPGLRAVSTGEAVPSWGVPRSMRFIGHVTLDPTNRADPWPPGMRALT